MRVAVVGHIEWVTFARVPHLPAPGEIVHATDVWDEAAGGGGVAAVQLARLAGACEFFTACGEEAETRLREHGVTVHAVRRPTRRGFTHTTPDGERTITVLGDRVVPRGDDPLPWERLAGCDAVYFTGGDPVAARAARAARVLVATPRAQAALAEVELDALVLSASDADEVRWSDGLRARHTLLTDGARGGRHAGGSWRAAPLPGAVVDAYGCGDSFAAGVTFALGRGDDLDSALALGARCGALCLTGRGPYGADLSPLGAASQRPAPAGPRPETAS